MYKDSLSCDRLQQTSSRGKVVVRALCFCLCSICETFQCSHSSKGECEHIRGSRGFVPLFLNRTLTVIIASTAAPLSVTMLLFTYKESHLISKKKNSQNLYLMSSDKHFLTK